MFDIGFWELAILFGLGLIVLGPEKLPRVANQLGNWAGQARRMARNLSEQMRSEIDLNDPLNINKPAAPKTPQDTTAAAAEKPEWQTSAGLRPGYSSEAEEAAASEEPDIEQPEEHPEYDPFADPESVAATTAAEDTGDDADTGGKSKT